MSVQFTRCFHQNINALSLIPALTKQHSLLRGLEQFSRVESDGINFNRQQDGCNFRNKEHQISLQFQQKGIHEEHTICHTWSHVLSMANFSLVICYN